MDDLWAPWAVRTQKSGWYLPTQSRATKNDSRDSKDWRGLQNGWYDWTKQIMRWTSSAGSSKALCDAKSLHMNKAKPMLFVSPWSTPCGPMMMMEVVVVVVLLHCLILANVWGWDGGTPGPGLGIIIIWTPRMFCKYTTGYSYIMAETKQCLPPPPPPPPLYSPKTHTTCFGLQ